MAKVKFTRDSAAIKQLLATPPFAALAHEAASRIAASAQAATPPGTDVVVDRFMTTPSPRLSQRPAASVTIRDRRARGWQARDGVLTRAAASIGAEVTER